ncbi:MAG: PA0069 family radical SAM protein [Nevskiaceae bacterium]
MSPRLRKGRGAVSNPEGRFESLRKEAVDDGWGSLEEELPPLETTVTADPARTIISRNDSPDIPFRLSINPYKGCEHGCIYCYARPTHAYLNLSPGLDFETRLFYKENAAELLDRELRKPGYACEAITIGANTDPYQPVERKLKVTRSLLEVAQRFRQPVTLITKGAALVERDFDILAEMARSSLAAVGVSITSLDDGIKRTLEPRAASPASRLRLVRRLREAGVPVMVLVAPVIPFITDAELERILEAAAQAGAQAAGYVVLRLPWEVKDLFREWLAANFPLKAQHVMSLVRQMRGGKDYDAEFGQRMRGQGEFAGLLEQRFRLATRRLGLNRWGALRLDTSQFRVPPAAGPQLGLDF